jgi:hypothetical protein
LDLEDVLRIAQVLEPVQAQIPKGHACREPVAYESGDRFGKKDLAAMADRRDPGRAVDVQADQAGGGLGRLASMNAHAHSHVVLGGPLVGFEGPLHFDYRRCACPWRREHGKKTVALGADLLPAVGGQARSDDPMVLSEDLGIRGLPQALEQGCRAFNVGKEKGQSLRGQSVRDGRALCTTLFHARVVSPIGLRLSALP